MKGTEKTLAEKYLAELDAIMDSVTVNYIDLRNIDKSKQMIEKDFTPLTDVRASSTYRKLVSKNLMDRLFLEINNNKIRI